MDDDEQHLIVLVRERVLRIEQLVEIEVLGIGQRIGQIPMHRLIAQIDERLGLRGGLLHRQVLKTQPGTVRQPASNSRSRRR